MLRCGKCPRDGRGGLFLAVTQAGSRAPIAPLIEALSIPPAVGHQGNRGLDRTRIQAEGDLFAAAQTAIDEGAVPAGATPCETHAALRGLLLARISPPAPRIGPAEGSADVLRLAAFLCAILFAAYLPGVLVSLVLPPFAALILLLAAGFALKARLNLPRHAPLPPGLTARLPQAAAATLAFTLALAALCAVPASFHHWRPEHYGWRVGQYATHFGLGLVGLFPTVAGLLVWLRALEMRDSPQDAPPRNEDALRAMANREDKVAQNHMGSIVHLKPGILRAVVVRVALRLLSLYLRVGARDGYLGSMRTIHFAHWALISNGSRLMFFSNFDGSWESYLDDFIEKEHQGLTLAWTSGVGFPPTRFLVLDGATQGRKFKAWARHSMAESLFWYSAYPSFTVNQIERQARVADGLRQGALGEKEAAQWALNL